MQLRQARGRAHVGWPRDVLRAAIGAAEGASPLRPGRALADRALHGRQQTLGARGALRPQFQLHGRSA